MKTIVVLTTIQSPTNCVQRWSNLKPDEIIVVGDRKTPDNWNCPNTRFFGIDEQEKFPFQLAGLLPENHYCRKMLGYLLAIRDGADAIFDTDDDNEPYTDSWAAKTAPMPDPDEKVLVFSTPRGFVNPYSFYLPKEIKAWPRGLPLELISSSDVDLAAASPESATNLEDLEFKIALWQGLVDGDPDLDAIHRLVYQSEFDFIKKEPIVLHGGMYSPFNSQNTLWVDSAVFPLLYLPTTVSFRYTDILRSYVALAIMEKFDLGLGFTPSSARQIRNDHNLLDDFHSEIPMYTGASMVMKELSKVSNRNLSIIENLTLCYQRLENLKVTLPEELSRLKAWLEDLSL